MLQKERDGDPRRGLLRWWRVLSGQCSQSACTGLVLKSDPQSQEIGISRLLSITEQETGLHSLASTTGGTKE